jgi:hypothetical protein
MQPGKWYTTKNRALCIDYFRIQRGELFEPAEAAPCFEWISSILETIT